MRARVSTRRHLLRDLPRAFVVLVCVSMGVSAFLPFYLQRNNPVTSLNESNSIFWPFYFYSSAPKQLDNPAKPTLNEFNIDKRYAGSIIVDARRRDMCHEIVFDNRTGATWERGYVAATSPWRRRSAAQKA